MMINDHSLLLIAFSTVFIAYLDPGSGSMLLSALIGIIATLFFIIKGLFFKLLNLTGFLTVKKNRLKESSDIIFYSEGKYYWNVFKPVIEEFENRKIRCTYLSGSKDDPGLQQDFEYIKSKYIGEGNKAFFTLNTLKAKICVMTTPGLDVLQIKRSKGVDKYCHITHSTAGCSGYSTYGIDYYDSILTSGMGDLKMIRELEDVRNLPRKKVIPVGCTYLDVLRANLKQDSDSPAFFDNELKTIILAPTWGKHGLLNREGDRLLSELTGESKYNVIVRPHPQSYIVEKKLISNLKVKFPDSGTLKWDANPNGIISMKQADVMISDFSGVIFDFLFLFERPVISFVEHFDKRGKDDMDLKDEPWPITMLHKLGASICDSDAGLINEKVDKIIIDNPSFKHILKELKNNMDMYPNESGVKAADAIIESLQQLNK